MGYTKRQLIEMALEEIGLAPATFNLSPEQFSSGLRRLDAMMATWNSKGVRLSYPLPASQADSDLNQNADIPDRAIEAVYLNLAVKLSPLFGKVVSPELRADAASSYNNIIRSNIDMKEMNLDNIPKGSGSKPWRYNTNQFISKSSDTSLQAGKDGDIILE